MCESWTDRLGRADCTGKSNNKELKLLLKSIEICESISPRTVINILDAL